MQDPLISIIIPTLNAGKYIAEALDSIRVQTYTNYEIIIVDGGSVDDTVQIVNGYSNIRLISQSDIGLAGAWNDGIRNANGEYICFLDSDDKWASDCLLQHVTLLKNDPGLTCSVGHAQFFLNEHEAAPAGFKMSLLNEHHLGYMPGCFLGKRDVFERQGLFETRWEVSSDLVWFSNLKKSEERIGILNETILFKRVHNRNLSYTTAQTPVYQKELLQLLHESIRKKGNK